MAGFINKNSYLKITSLLAGVGLIFAQISITKAEIPATHLDEGGRIPKILGIKCSRPIGWSEEPTGTRGEPWYSTVYDDRAWLASRYEEKNTVPSKKSQLFRLPVQVSVPPLPESKWMLRIVGDDDLTVYLDGYRIQSYGSVKTGGQSAGEVYLDLTDRLTIGNHLVAVRLDNGSGDSLISFQLLDMTTGSTEDIRKNFWKNLASKDEKIKRDTILKTRKLAQENPSDQDMQLKAVYSYAYAPEGLKDIKQAEQVLNTYKSQGFKIGADEEARILKEIGRLDLAIPQLRMQMNDPVRYPDAAVKLGDLFFNKGDKQQAQAAYEVGFRIALEKNFELSKQLALSQRLLEVGSVNLVLSKLSQFEKRASEDGQWKSCAWIGRLYETVGDFEAASKCFTRYEQLGDTTSSMISNYHRINRAFISGDFVYCLSLIDGELGRKELMPYYREDYGVYKVRIYAAQGKMPEAERACGAITWRSADPDNQIYLQKYLLVASALNIHPQMSAAAKSLKTKTDSAIALGKQPRREDLIELAECLHKLGDKESAAKYANIILDLAVDVSLPSNQWIRGRSAVLLGDRKQATTSLTKAKNLDPKNYWVERALKQLNSYN